jgi:hypothetical protein
MFLAQICPGGFMGLVLEKKRTGNDARVYRNHENDRNDGRADHQIGIGADDIRIINRSQ